MINVEIDQELERVLAGLKDFQLATVNNTVFKFQDLKHSHRVLIADEVGLGKTIVAKGVIARLLRLHLERDTVVPLRIIYICSNLALADENKQKLSIFKGDNAARWVKPSTFGRLVELAIELKESSQTSSHIIEVCTLTPATSFTLTAGAGNRRERAILAVLLSQISIFKDKALSIYQLFKTSYISRDDRWQDEICYIKNSFNVDQRVIVDLEKRLVKQCLLLGLSCRFKTLKEAVLYVITEWDKHGGETEVNKQLFNLFRAEIRRQVAQCCASHLQADLFILDEFQRFQSLTDQSPESEESLIAQQVFSRSLKKANAKPKVLLLSATPFKAMTTLLDEDDETSHHEQLHKLLDFLSSNDVDFVTQYEINRDLLHRDMLALSSGSSDFENIKDINARAVEKLLQTYLCRTERSQISKGFEQLIESNELCCGEDFHITEVLGYRALEALSSLLPKSRGAVSLIEFAKATPWALSFLHGYAFKDLYHRNIQKSEVKALLRDSKHSEQHLAWLSRSAIQRYQMNVGQSAPNAKVKALSKVIFEQQPENLLWVPPCKPYYEFDGVFKSNNNFTKTLLFSSWAIVPKALSCLWSYEAERRVLKGKGRVDEYYNDKNVSPLLRFEGQSTLNVWLLLYPCKSISEISFSGQNLNELLQQQTALIREKLNCLKCYESEEKSSSNWYLLAPMLLDKSSGKSGHVKSWLQVTEIHLNNQGRLKHFREIKSLFEREKSLKLGKMPDDLAKVLAYSSIANPAVCAMRTIQKLWSKDLPAQEIIACSVRLAEFTVRLFNHEYATPIVKRNIKGTLEAGRTASPNWYKVLLYCAHGNFQSMLDEYCHLLASSGCSLEAALQKIEQAMAIRSSNEQVHFWEDRAKAKDKCSSSMRCHFAVPLGNQKLTDDSGLQRVVSVRDAFNSPFRPFVLSSTSIGQEGLDFHWYCRRVVHWNLPSNPIDIEQREGRINRYKSYVVRKRVAESVSPNFDEQTDIWEQMFELATKVGDENCSDLEPYWYMRSGTAKIERIVPTYPMSREVTKYRDIKRILVLYRLAFGQPRQQELLERFIGCDVDNEKFQEIKDSLIINLAPINEK